MQVSCSQPAEKAADLEAVASSEGPDGLFATLESSRLIIRSAQTKTLLQNISLDAKLVGAARYLKWYRPKTFESPSQRLLLATSDDIHVYDAKNPKWQATVKKACGEGNKIVHVEFGASQDEILAFSAFGMKVSIWSLTSGVSTEVRDPKSPPFRTCSTRDRSGHIAILNRAASKDVVTVLSPDRREVEVSISLPTVDVQGIKWSPDGMWLAAWDAASAGSSVLIYSATGQLFKSFGGGEHAEDLSYGIQRLSWDAQNRYLIAATNQDKIVLLDTRAFQPTVALDFSGTIASSYAHVHEERIAADGNRGYEFAQQPVSPPAKPGAIGFSQLAVSDASLVASVTAGMPTAVWIHSIHPQPQLNAVLVHHGTVKHVCWHPQIPGLLLIHCSASGPDSTESSATNPNVYVWGYDLPQPLVVPIAAASSTAITNVAWLKTAEPLALVSTAKSCTAVDVLDPEADADDEAEFPTPKPVPRQRPRRSVEATPTVMLGYDAETPMTSASKIGFSPIKMDTAQLTKTLGFQFTSLGDDEADDTFDFKKPLRTAV